MIPDSSNQFSQYPKPPKIAQKLLDFLLKQEDKEVVLGDFEEEYYWIARKKSVQQAKVWYWLEILRSMSALLFLGYKKSIRSQRMRKNHLLVLLGILLVLPAFILVLGGVAQSGFGVTKINDALNFNLIIFHPAVIMGGLVLAFILNLLPVVQFKYQDGILTSTLTIRNRLLNVGLAGCIGLLVAAIIIYLLAENFQVFQLIS